MSGKTKTDRFGRGGFTLTELLIASSVSLTVVTATIAISLGIFKSWHELDGKMQTDHDANFAISHMLYGVDARRGIRSASDVALTQDTNGWALTYATSGSSPQTNSFTYSAQNKTLVFNPGAVTVGRNISLALLDVQSRSLVVTLRVDTVKSGIQSSCEAGTEIAWRN